MILCFVAYHVLMNWNEPLKLSITNAYLLNAIFASAIHFIAYGSEADVNCNELKMANNVNATGATNANPCDLKGSGEKLHA